MRFLINTEPSRELLQCRGCSDRMFFIAAESDNDRMLVVCVNCSTRYWIETGAPRSMEKDDGDQVRENQSTETDSG